VSVVDLDVEVGEGGQELVVVLADPIPARELLVPGDVVEAGVLAQVRMILLRSRSTPAWTCSSTRRMQASSASGEIWSAMGSAAAGAQILSPPPW
jgi:hypothetical protein